jgi:gas vesicle protein
MSYAGPTRSGTSDRSGRAPFATQTSAGRAGLSAAGALPGREPSGSDWQQLSVFGAGLALGIAVGAGVALMTAPRSGAETRAALRSGAGRIRRTTSRRGRDAWDDLRDELRNATRALRRRKARRLARRELARESRLD